MDAATLHRDALGVAQSVVDRIAPAQLDLPTPCEELLRDRFAAFAGRRP